VWPAPGFAPPAGLPLEKKKKPVPPRLSKPRPTAFWFFGLPLWPVNPQKHAHQRGPPSNTTTCVFAAPLVWAPASGVATDPGASNPAQQPVPNRGPNLGWGPLQASSPTQRRFFFSFKSPSPPSKPGPPPHSSPFLVAFPARGPQTKKIAPPASKHCEKKMPQRNPRPGPPRGQPFPCQNRPNKVRWPRLSGAETPFNKGQASFPSRAQTDPRWPKPGPSSALCGRGGPSGAPGVWACQKNLAEPPLHTNPNPL